MINLAQPSFVFVALPCEARPFIRAWRLKRQLANQPFAIYGNPEIVLVISGIGKIAMAAAVAHTMAQFNPPAPPIMLNIGIAGHRSQPIGRCFLVDKVTDADTKRCFYPQLVFDSPGETLPLISLSAPDAEYADDNLRDMEASAFYEIAVKFSSSEMIHCLKIISDNIHTPLSGISEEVVESLLTVRLSEVEALLTTLTTLRCSLPVNTHRDLYERLLGQFHFTATNAHMLNGLLNRWKILRGDAELPIGQAKLRNAKELLIWLEGLIDGEEFCL